MGSNVPPMTPTRPPATDEPIRAHRSRPERTGPGRRMAGPARRPGPAGPPRPAPPCSRSQSGPRSLRRTVPDARSRRHRAANARDGFGYGPRRAQKVPSRATTAGRHAADDDGRPPTRGTFESGQDRTAAGEPGAQRVVTNSASWAALRHSTMSMTSPYRSAAESPLPHSRRGSGLSQCADRDRRTRSASTGSPGGR